MIDIFKTWISELIGLSIFAVIIELILPNGKIKKYVYMIMRNTYSIFNTFSNCKYFKQYFCYK